MIPGTKCVGIFGFCDIRNFTDTTEILQEKVMMFVNTIADIVHSYVDQYAGAPNKNIGDAFLLVWKIPSRDTYFDSNSRQILPNRNGPNWVWCEMAFMSFVLILAGIRKSR